MTPRPVSACADSPYDRDGAAEDTLGRERVLLLVAQGNKTVQSRWKGNPSRKGTGFEKPLQPHEHWRIDVSYINLSGTFYYL
jgi:hypothetical protein